MILFSIVALFCSSVALAESPLETKGGWELVARKTDHSTGKTYEVWKDTQTGLLWGDRLDSEHWYVPSRWMHFSAVKLSRSGDVTKEIACGAKSRAAQRAAAGLMPERSFRLPTISEFVEAEWHGIRNVLPNMKNRVFWSATRGPVTAKAFGFDGTTGDTPPEYPWRERSIRCVSP